MKSVSAFLGRSSLQLSITAVLVVFFCLHGFFSNTRSELIKSDGLGYYAYLPAKFIYHDNTFSFMEKCHKDNYQSIGLQGFTNEIGGKKVDKYFVGTAVLLLPFFLLAHWLSLLFGMPADGYSLLYQYFTGLGAIFYLGLGLLYTKRLLKIYGASPGSIAFILASIVFGTILFHYTVLEPSMSHVYSFAMISAFLYYGKKLFTEDGLLLPVFISLAFVILIRPVNGLVILALPFLAGDGRTLLKGLKSLGNFRDLGFSLIFFFLILFIQAWAWYKQTGSFMVWSYGEEGFNFSDPYFYSALFSYKKGLFVYTPLFFLALAGFIQLRKHFFALSSLLLFLLVLVFVLSSWHDWSYGMSYGYRPMIEYLPFAALLLHFALQALRPFFMKALLGALMLGCVLLNQVQDFQYRNYILHWSIMSGQKYWKVFLKTSDKYKGYLWDIMYYDDVHGEVLASYSTDLEKPAENWDVPLLGDDGTKAHSGKRAAITDNANQYGPTLKLKSGTLVNKTAETCVRVKLWKYSEAIDTSAMLIISIDSANGKNYSYWRVPFEKVSWKKMYVWEEVRFGAPLKAHGDPDDIIKIYVWNRTGGRMLIDDFEVEFLR